MVRATFVLTARRVCTSVNSWDSSLVSSADRPDRTVWALLAFAEAAYQVIACPPAGDTRAGKVETAAMAGGVR